MRWSHNPANAEPAKSERERNRLRGERTKAAAIAADVILESMLDGVGVIDIQGRFIQANTALAEIHGYSSPAELIGKTFFDAVAKEELPKVTERFKESMRKKEKIIKNFEVIILRKDGSKLPSMINITNLWDKDGNLIGSIAVIRDITERKRAEEEKLKAAADRQRIEELEKFAKIAVGRELRMVELKERIKELESKLKEITEKE